MVAKTIRQGPLRRPGQPAQGGFRRVTILNVEPSSRSFQRDGHSTHRRRQLHANLAAGQLQYHTFLILQLHAASTGRQRSTSADRAVGSLDIASDCAGSGRARTTGGRCADREADAHPGDLERITMAMEVQNAVTAADADDEPALGEDHPDRCRYLPSTATQGRMRAARSRRLRTIGHGYLSHRLFSNVVMSVWGRTGLIQGDHHLGDVGGHFDACPWGPAT